MSGCWSSQPQRKPVLHTDHDLRGLRDSLSQHSAAQRSAVIRRLARAVAACALTGLLLALGAGQTVSAATTVRLPGWACSGNSDRIFRSGLQHDEYVPSRPSAGSGGAAPGQQLRTLAIGGLGSGTQKIHLYIPPSYDPRYPLPLVLVLHGSAGSPANADLYAQDVRNTWQGTAAARGFIVTAPVANGAGGSWDDDATPNDYTFLAAVMTDLRAAYNIDDSRIQLWGFSAGGHLAHDLLVNGAVGALDENHVSAYSVSAGRLFALACLGDSEAGCQNRLDSQTRKLPLDIHLGTADPMYGPPYNASQDPGRFSQAGWVIDDTLNYYTFGGGHTYEAGHFSDIWGFFCRFALGP